MQIIYAERSTRTQPIDTVDIPEVAWPRTAILAEWPEDQYELKAEVDLWAAGQCIHDLPHKRFGLAWLALDELTRLEHCENYLGAVQDRRKP